jgi:hypothetical protein
MLSHGTISENYRASGSNGISKLPSSGLALPSLAIDHVVCRPVGSWGPVAAVVE